MNRKAVLRRNRQTKLKDNCEEIDSEITIDENTEVRNEIGHSKNDINSTINQPNLTSTSSDSIPQVMDECHRNEMDSRDCNECRMEINCNKKIHVITITL